MTKLLTATQMRGIEQAAIASGGLTGLELMERAGQGVVDAIHAHWPKLSSAGQRAVILCGPGNNGGDGFVVARLLAGLSWDVDVFLYGDAERLPPDARLNYARWCEIGSVAALTDDAIDGYAEAHPRTDIAIDAIFGTGLSRPFVDLGRVQDELNYWQASSPHEDTPHVVAVDIVSGVCADSGRYLGMDDENPFDLCAMANLTVTFHRKKLGHLLAQGAVGCGPVVVCDIGIEPYQPQDDIAFVAEAEGKAWRFAKGVGGHKYLHGSVLVLSGGFGRGGAARLAARGALRVGAGVVTVGCPPSALMENAIALDAVMVRKMADDAALGAALEDTRINALCLGPGFGTGAREVALLRAALASGRPLVLDADALTILAAEPDLFAMLHEKCVLTPHAGEFGRLFPDLAADLAESATMGPAYSKVDATRKAAARAGCVVLFKGPDTVIAGPDGLCRINAAVFDRAAPWLATAGAGDVLAGFIAGLMARGHAAIQAAEAAAWLHVECARSFGPGLIAEDLPEQVPQVFRELGL